MTEQLLSSLLEDLEAELAERNGGRTARLLRMKANIMAAQLRVDPRHGAICHLCNGGFTEDEWVDRHSDGLEELHAECCVALGPCAHDDDDGSATGSQNRGMDDDKEIERWL